MTLPSRLPQQRHHVIIFDEDWLWLVHNYGPQAIDPKKRIGVSCAIRELIHARVKELRAKQVAALDNNEQRACTCHPDERPFPCQEKYALSECRKAYLATYLATKRE